MRFDPLDIGTALLRRLPPDLAHRAALWALRRRLLPVSPPADDPILAVRVLGLDFANPIGLAAGFDKDAEALDGLLALGFGFVEAGTVTPAPQPGNPRPNLFRLAAEAAMINRLGFPSRGLEVFAANLAAWRRGGRRRGIVGANIGINRDCADPAGDFARGAAALAGLADYLVVNVSSPNTPGLRALQDADALAGVIAQVRAARDAAAAHPPLLIKISPDLAPDEMAAIADLAPTAGIDGLIVANTTVRRPATLASPQAGESGGLSGAPLFPVARAAVAEMYRLTGGATVLIGCGGVASGAEAYAMIRAGASLVQLYTALIYRGPGLVGRIRAELAALLRRDGFSSLAAAIGADVRPPPPVNPSPH